MFEKKVSATRIENKSTKRILGRRAVAYQLELDIQHKEEGMDATCNAETKKLVAMTRQSLPTQARIGSILDVTVAKVLVE